MNHDIAHCDGLLHEDHHCTRKLNCVRYLAHLNLQKNPTLHHRIAYISALGCVEDNYNEPYSSYWDAGAFDVV